MPISRTEIENLTSSSRGVHAGRTVELGNAEPTSPPIHLATAFTYPTTAELDEVFADNSRGYVYSRMGNPTVRLLGEAIAILDGMDEGIVYSSGMAAIHGVITSLAKAGSQVIASRDVYGATFAMLRTHLAEFGIETTFVDVTDLDGVRKVVREVNPALVLAETISNPLLKVVDVRELAGIAQEAGATFVLDNTFATPVVTRGGDLGADVIVYSSTKHIGGHGDTTGGLVATSSTLAPAMREQLKMVGSVASPFDAWLVLRGMRTLDLRVRKQCENACALAAWLQQHPRVVRVHYPGMDTALPSGQFADDLRGTMLSFELADAGREEVFRFQDTLRMVQPAATLGDIHTIVLHPATTSHRFLSEEDREEIGIGDGLVRVSAGIEDIRDIIDDLDQAITRAFA